MATELEDKFRILIQICFKNIRTFKDLQWQNSGGHSVGVCNQVNF